jgi:hypothetical protein
MQVVLNSLASRIIWAIVECGIAGIKAIVPKNEQSQSSAPPTENRDIFDIGPNLRELAIALSNNATKPSKLTISCRRSNASEDIKVEIPIPAGN